MKGSLTQVENVAVYYSSPLQKTDRTVLLIHEWWGLNENIKREADGFAELGYQAAALDLYDGKIARDKETASRFMGMDKPAESRVKLQKVLRWLRAKSCPIASSRVVTIGWCFGGGYSLQCALHYTDLVDGAVIYYGLLETDAEELRSCRVPLLGIFARQDEWITPDSVDRFEQACQRAGVKVEVHRYDAQHAFANPSNPQFDRDATSDATQKVQTFLKRVMA